MEVHIRRYIKCNKIDFKNKPTFSERGVSRDAHLFPLTAHADAPFLASSGIHTHAADVGLGSSCGENDYSAIFNNNNSNNNKAS
jgi:hypothetical protein